MCKKMQFKILYNWADQLFFDQKISASVLHTLKAIIACGYLKQPTLGQISDARTRSAARKFAQDDIVTKRTIRRHIQQLEKLGLIKVDRDHKAWDNRNSYVAMAPAQNLADQRGDMMSPSIPRATSPSSIVIPSHSHKGYSNDNDYVKEEIEMRNRASMSGVMRKVERRLQVTPETHPVFLRAMGKEALALFSPDELAIYDKLIELGVYERLALDWVSKHSIAELANLIEASLLYGANNRGAYINQSVKELSEHKEMRPYIPAICHKPWEPGAIMSKSSRNVGLERIREIKVKMQK